MPDPVISVDPMIDFLVGLLNTPSPTGYTIEAIAYARAAFETLGVPGLSCSVTPKGALMMTLPGQRQDAPRGVTAHVDTLGLMVRAIKPSGRLKTTQLGGYMWNAVEFEGVTVRTFDNRRFRGTLLPENPSTHVNNKVAEATRTPDLMEVRLDVRVASAADTRSLGIGVGDFVFLDPRVEVTDTGFIRSRHLDDKAGVAAVYGALMAMRDANLTPAQDTIFMISNYEEVGHGGSANWRPDLAELLVIDMGAIGVDQASDEYSVSICVKDASGPYHFEMNRKLRRLATAHDIPHRADIYTYYGSDGSAYWRAGGSARVGLIGPGVDASHAYERTHTDSVKYTAELLMRYLLEA